MYHDVHYLFLLKLAAALAIHAGLLPSRRLSHNQQPKAGIAYSNIIWYSFLDRAALGSSERNRGRT